MQQAEQDNEAARNWPDYQSGFSPPREFLPRLLFVNGIKHGRHLVGIIPQSGFFQLGRVRRDSSREHRMTTCWVGSRM
jgi:hypothetical protein